MSEVWVAAIGAVVTTGIGVAAQKLSAPGPGSVGAPLKFDPIDINKVQQDAINTSIQGYDLSDADRKRFPGLVPALNATTEDAYKQLTSPLDPTVQNTFATNSAISALQSGGGGDALASLGPAGSASQNQFTTSLLNQVQQKQDYDRSYLDSLLAANPERAFGLSGSDAANLNIANVQGQNAYNQQKYTQQVAQENANNAGGGF